MIYFLILLGSYILFILGSILGPWGLVMLFVGLFVCLCLHALYSDYVEMHGLKLQLGFYKIDIPPNRRYDEMIKNCRVMSSPLHRAMVEMRGDNPDNYYEIGSYSGFGMGSSSEE